jgi:ribonucleotide reductase beta subunit family protein with ferritin-like domain
MLKETLDSIENISKSILDSKDNDEGFDESSKSENKSSRSDVIKENYSDENSRQDKDSEHKD